MERVCIASSLLGKGLGISLSPKKLGTDFSLLVMLWMFTNESQQSECHVIVYVHCRISRLVGKAERLVF